MMENFDINNRYVLPTIEEKTSYGFKRLDPYTKLFEERIIFLGQAIDDTVANDVMARSEEHTSEPSHLGISYAVFCLMTRSVMFGPSGPLENYSRSMRMTCGAPAI